MRWGDELKVRAWRGFWFEPRNRTASARAGAGRTGKRVLMARPGLPVGDVAIGEVRRGNLEKHFQRTR